MVQKLIEKGKKLFSSQQSSVFSAATIIMLMIVASRVLGLVRQRVLTNYFDADSLSLFFAAFRLPDTVFEVLVFGTFSSAFIPVFTRALKKGRKVAWDIAGYVTNIGLIIFLILAILIIIFSSQLYGIIAPGYPMVDRSTIVLLTRILFAAQGFFVISYVMTGVLESLRRFLVPALAPLFYNLGIILGTLFLTKRFGLMAPAIGVVIGAFAHFAIQLPLAIKMGFRFKTKIALTPEVKAIGRLALPRLIEVSVLQVAKSVELFLASLISTASYTYFTLGNTIQLLPVGLVGTSVAKAALPTLSRQGDKPEEFKRTLFSALNQMVFLIMPIATCLLVLRIPIVRLVFGASIFTWESTVQTGMVVSAFAFGIVFQATNSLLARAFYALHDTRTPVIISVCAITVNIIADFILIRSLGLPAWGLAAAFSLGAFIQSVVLYIFLSRRIGDGATLKRFVPTLKVLIATILSGSAMFFLLKIFDRSVWVKRLSFLGRIEGIENIHFEKFVLDTRYTINVLVLTIFVTAIGGLIYILVSLLLRSKELFYFTVMIGRIFKKKMKPLGEKELEPVVPPSNENPEV
jgi:putative peptidoglycan lipid II flippase